MKKNEIVIRNNRSFWKRICSFVRGLGELYEERIELRREKEAFGLNNRYREYQKF